MARIAKRDIDIRNSTRNIPVASIVSRLRSLGIGIGCTSNRVLTRGALAIHGHSACASQESFDLVYTKQIDTPNPSFANCPACVAFCRLPNSHSSFAMSFLSAASAGTTSNTQGDLSKDIALNSPPEDSISQLNFSPTADFLAVSSWDKKVRIYQVNEQGQSEGKAAIDFDGPVLSCAWSTVREQNTCIDQVANLSG